MVARIAVFLIILLASLQATTLQKLSLDDMTAQSTAIVHGRVTGSYAAQNGPIIFTHFTVQVLERWKDPAATVVDIAVPGGTVGAKTQSVGGAPLLDTGSEYMFFLWTGKSGVTQILGLYQGLLTVTAGASGELMVSRPAGSALMLDSSGKSIPDSGLQMRLRDLTGQISRNLSAGGAK